MSAHTERHAQRAWHLEQLALASAGPWPLQVVDYTSQDVGELYRDQPFDIAIDCMGTRSECQQGCGATRPRGGAAGRTPARMWEA